MKVALCVRPDRPDAVRTAREAAQRMRRGGHEVVDVDLDTTTADVAKGATIACILGGDGTMLRAARAMSPLGIPMLGVNLVARGAAVRSIHVAVRVDGELLIVYWADGVIVATATGSTAYGFSVGGPLILPSSRAIMLVPIAPHLSFGNAIAFDPDQRIELEVRDPARISIDGQEEHDLLAGDRIGVRRSDVVAKFVRTSHARPFLSLLREKILKEPGT